MALLDELPKMLLMISPVLNASVFASLIQDLHGKIRQAWKHQLFPFHFFRESSHLLMQGGKKKQQPRSPVGSNCADRSLRLSKREIVSFLVLLDHALE